ncbi:MAG: hypothetical protein F6K10_05160 [Moorea sp. SIO2B7]|nr:hypothetical protein [Moorena sp. SIO2B7]
MKILQSSFLWMFCFTVISLLSLDFWSWEQEISFSFFHLPPWIFYFIILQVILSLAIWLFAFNFWEKTS